MENINSAPSPEIEKDIFNEYLRQPIYVLLNLDNLDESLHGSYQKVTGSSGALFVRNDVMNEIEKRLISLNNLDKRLEDILGQGILQRILRPVLKKRYEDKDREKEINDAQKNEEMRRTLIKNKVVEEAKRIEIAEFVATFPLAIQKSLKEGAFLISTEGKYFESVENGTESFASAEDKKDYKSIKEGQWKRGLFQTLQAGSPFVKSFLPAVISGAYGTFKAELKDTIVTCVVTGNNFSSLKNNNLCFTLEYEEFGETKKVSRFFEPF